MEKYEREVLKIFSFRSIYPLPSSRLTFFVYADIIISIKIYQ